MMKVKVALETMSDIYEFVSLVSKIEEPVFLVGEEFKVSAKSLLGAMYTMEWQEIWCECEKDIYGKISKFILI